MNTKIRAGVASVALALLTAACGGTPANDNGGNGSVDESLPGKIDLADGTNPDGHFTWATIQFATSWDPVTSLSGGDLPFWRQVYDRLLDLGADGELKPMLATEWETSDDNKSVTFTLREGLTFSDGTPFNAEAVKFNLERNAAEGSSVRSESAAFASAEVIDEYTIKVNVQYGLGAYLTALSVRSGVMVSPQAAQSGALAQGPVGIGPYVTTSIVPGDRVELEKSPDYWDPEAQQVATMTYRLMTDDQTRLNALQSGDVDGIFLSQGQINSAVDMGMNVVTAESSNFLYVAVNASKAPFDNAKAREAINYAIDRQGIADGLYDGYCTPSIQPWPSTSMAYNDEIGDGSDIWPYDVEKAKELLAEAGVEGEIEINLLTPNPTMFVQLAEVVQQQISAVGINATVKTVPAAQLVQEFSVNQTVEAATLPYVGLPDPQGVMNYLMPGHPYNIGQAATQQTIDDAMAAAAPADPAERKELYQKVVQDMVDNPTQIMPICLLHLASAYSPKVSNVEQLPYDAPTNRGVAVSD